MSPLVVTATLDPETLAGWDADWWVFATTPQGLRWFTLDRGWIASDTPVAVYSGPLFALDPYTIYYGPLEVGLYTAYFGIDLKRNGILDGDVMYLSAVSAGIY